MPLFIQKARDFDIVLGSRYVDGRVNSDQLAHEPPPYQLLRELVCPIRDTPSSAGRHRRLQLLAAKGVLESLDFERVESNGYTFQIELKFRAWRKGFTFTEIPIVFEERESGESKMSKKIVREAIWKVWKLRFSIYSDVFDRTSLFGRLLRPFTTRMSRPIESSYAYADPRHALPLPAVWPRPPRRSVREERRCFSCGTRFEQGRGSVIIVRPPEGPPEQTSATSLLADMGGRVREENG